MSLYPVDKIVRTIPGLHSWFTDIWKHLGPNNYRNGDWTPVLTGITAGQEHYPSSLTVSYGSVAAGDVNSVDEYGDYDILQIAEAASTPGFSFYFTFTSMTSFTGSISLRGWYDGNISHTVKLQIYNFNTTVHDDITADTTDFPPETESHDYVFDLPADMTDYISGGQIRLRLYHATTGNVVHTMYIDEFKIVEAGTSYTATGYYQRWGRINTVGITITGSHTAKDATITNLPEPAKSAGVLQVHNMTHNTIIGTATVTAGSSVMSLPDYVNSGDSVLICGKYPISGI